MVKITLIWKVQNWRLSKDCLDNSYAVEKDTREMELWTELGANSRCKFREDVFRLFPSTYCIAATLPLVWFVS